MMPVAKRPETSVPGEAPLRFGKSRNSTAIVTQTHRDRVTTVRSTWSILRGESSPRLTGCFLIPASGAPWPNGNSSLWSRYSKTSPATASCFPSITSPPIKPSHPPDPRTSNTIFNPPRSSPPVPGATIPRSYSLPNSCLTASIPDAAISLFKSPRSKFIPIHTPRSFCPCLVTSGPRIVPSASNTESTASR